MLLHHGARFFLLHSALARLALMSLCYSPTSPSTSAIPAAWQQHHARPAKKRHHLAVEDQPLLPVVFNKADGAKKTAASRGRPPRLVIPPPVPCAAPFGVAADRETDVATEVEVQGQGFCLATRRGVRHAMEDGYAVITAVDDHIAGGSQMVTTFYISLPWFGPILNHLVQKLRIKIEATSCY
jgi:protein phosphatase 1L